MCPIYSQAEFMIYQLAEDSELSVVGHFQQSLT